VPRPALDQFTPPEGAGRVGVHAETVRGRVSRGLIPVVVRERQGTGGRQWVRWAAVRAFGERHAVGTDRLPWLGEPKRGIPE